MLTHASCVVDTAGFGEIGEIGEIVVLVLLVHSCVDCRVRIGLLEKNGLTPSST